MICSWAPKSVAGTYSKYGATHQSSSKERKRNERFNESVEVEEGFCFEVRLGINVKDLSSNCKGNHTTERQLRRIDSN